MKKADVCVYLFVYSLNMEYVLCYPPLVQQVGTLAEGPSNYNNPHK